IKTIEALPANADDKPVLAVDVADIGGMCAGKIHLMGTEQGVGVRNAGEMGADAGSVVISADGKIINHGKINAKTQIALTTNQAVTNEGQIATEQGQMTVNSKQHFYNKGQIVSK